MDHIWRIQQELHRVLESPDGDYRPFLINSDVFGEYRRRYHMKTLSSTDILVAWEVAKVSARFWGNDPIPAFLGNTVVSSKQPLVKEALSNRDGCTLASRTVLMEYPWDNPVWTDMIEDLVNVKMVGKGFITPYQMDTHRWTGNVASCVDKLYVLSNQFHERDRSVPFSIIGAFYIAHKMMDESGSRMTDEYLETARKMLLKNNPFAAACLEPRVVESMYLHFGDYISDDESGERCLPHLDVLKSLGIRLFKD